MPYKGMLSNKIGWYPLFRDWLGIGILVGDCD